MRLIGLPSLAVAILWVATTETADAQHIGDIACQADTVFVGELVSRSPAASPGAGDSASYDVEVSVVRVLKGRLSKKTMTVRGVSEIIFKHYSLGDQAVLLTKGTDFLRIESINAEVIVGKIANRCS
ncbi:MAG: hypothetical protein AAFX44_06485 [Pseudomonadota bacterium]